jgi:hypothetical protein
MLFRLVLFMRIAADLISRERPSNQIDLIYVYYLPFCQVFTSSDKLHERVVPLFLRQDQTFVKGQELKADLHKLDEYYSALSEEVKASGLHRFADYPPEDTAFLVTQLWDAHRLGLRQAELLAQLPIQEQLHFGFFCQPF